jgi:hypothetical protein
MKAIVPVIVLMLGLLAVPGSHAQEFSFDAFVGTWEGTISSDNFGGYDDPITLVVESDGYYTDSSGRLMPTLYPDTQQCEYDEATNRVHFWYLQLVYSGQYFYQHFYLEVVSYTGDTLELHYNFHDDDVPHPDAMTIALVRSGVTAVDDGTEVAPAIVSPLAAYPNPFNPATRVALEMARAGHARLDVVDLRGRRVAVLHDGLLPAGRHEMEWRGRDDAGRAVPGGVYLARLVTAAGSRTVKLSLAK